MKAIKKSRTKTSVRYTVYKLSRCHAKITYTPLLQIYQSLLTVQALPNKMILYEVISPEQIADVLAFDAKFKIYCKFSFSALN